MAKETNKQKALKLKAARVSKKTLKQETKRLDGFEPNEVIVQSTRKPKSGRWFVKKRSYVIRRRNGEKIFIVGHSGSPTMKKDTRSGGPKAKVIKG